MTRGLLLVVLPILAAAQTTRPDDLAAVAGRVNNAATGEPLRKVTLTLRRTDGGGPGGPAGPRSYTATSDSAGAFLIPGVEPGQYRLSARRTGFVDLDYGTQDYLHAGSTLKLSAKQKLDNLQIAMQPGAVIAGKVVDEDGDPMAGLQVEAFRYRYTQGKKQLTSYGTGTTNDIGEYRVPGLPAGRYYLAVTPQRGGWGNGRFGRPAQTPAEAEEYVRTFYPGTTDAGAAAPLEATPGAQLSRIDLAVARKRTVSVRGRVTDASGTAAQQGGRTRVTVSLRPHDLGGAGSTRSAMVDSAGNFEIRGVVAGSYDLVAAIASRDAALSARIPVEVGHASIDNLRVTINPPLTLSGSVRLDGKPATSLAGMQVSLRRTDTVGPFSGGTLTAKTADDGAFSISGVNPDRYTLSLTGAPDGSYVKSVRLGGQEASLAGLDLARAGGSLEILLSPTAGTVTGLVQNDQQQPAAGASVVLIPQEPERRDQAQYYKTATADDAGQFTLKNISPGQYRVYAWTEIESGAYMDPDVIRPVENRGEPVTVKDSDVETVQVKLIG